MSAYESFLARWARRKHAAATNARDEAQPKDPGNRAAAESGAPTLS
jgi:hypothetical protein